MKSNFDKLVTSSRHHQTENSAIHIDHLPTFCTLEKSSVGLSFSSFLLYPCVTCKGPLLALTPLSWQRIQKTALPPGKKKDVLQKVLCVFGFKMTEETWLWALLLKIIPKTPKRPVCLLRLEDICYRNNHAKRQKEAEEWGLLCRGGRIQTMLIGMIVLSNKPFCRPETQESLGFENIGFSMKEVHVI